VTDRITRAKRDAQVLQLFIAGVPYRQIGERHNITHTAVEKIVQREMAKAAKRRDYLADQALAMHVERSEALFRAHFGNALNGDVKAAEFCRRLLAQQTRLYGLDAATPGMNEPGERP
jgi:DNA-binding CsgD family transcriptional regulator